MDCDVFAIKELDQYITGLLYASNFSLKGHFTQIMNQGFLSTV